MEKYEETDVAVKEAKEDYEKFLTDAQLREAQFQHEMFLHDQAQAQHDAKKAGYNEGFDTGYTSGHDDGITQGISQGISQGITQGISQGEHEKAVAVAKNMLALGMATDVIAKVTGLMEEAVKSIK